MITRLFIYDVYAKVFLTVNQLVLSEDFDNFGW